MTDKIPTTSTENPFGGYRKKCYRLGEFFMDLGALFPRMTDIWAIWAKRRVDPLPEGDRGEISRSQTSDSDPGKELAISYAESLASSDFRQVPEELRREVTNLCGATQCRDIETVARVMTLANRSFNTVEALFSRMKGQPSGHSRLVDELLIGVAFALLYPVVILMVSLLRRRSPISVVRGFLAFRGG